MNDLKYKVVERKIVNFSLFGKFEEDVFLIKSKSFSVYRTFRDCIYWPIIFRESYINKFIKEVIR